MTELPTPMQTRTLLRKLLDGGLLTYQQFQAMHHLGDHVLSFYEYLGKIDSYQNQDSRNLKLHYALSDLAEKFS